MREPTKKRLTRFFSHAIILLMKIIRSTRCTLRFATEAKRATLRGVLAEYGRVVNIFIEHFWKLPELPTKGELLKPIMDIPADSWLSHRLRQVAAREALSIIVGVRKRWKEKAVLPVHKGQSMYVSVLIANLHEAKNATGFDCWLHLQSIGRKTIFDLPIKRHRHFNRLAERGKRLNSYIISEKDVQFAFEIETGPKKEVGTNLGIDTGINTLAALSTGERLGTDMKSCVERIKRCKQGSKGQKRARRALKHRMDEVAKQIFSTSDLRLVVVERLKNLNKNTKVKRRLTKNIRRSIGSWNYRYWLNRVQSQSEDNRVVFRSVNPWKTSIECSACGHVDRRNRNGEKFLCLKCGYIENADTNASKNILDRFLTGKYGAGFKCATAT